MNIPGSIEAELKAAREQGRREGIREALKACASLAKDAESDALDSAASGDDVEDYEDAVMLDEEMERVINRFARLMAHYDRVELRGKK